MGFSFTEGAFPNIGADLIRALAYGTNAWVGVGDNGRIIRSTDNGVTWTQPTSPSANGWSSVAFNGTDFVAVGSGAGLRTMISHDDGVTWTANASALETSNWKAVVWAGTKWVAVASSGATRTMNSVNGTAWTGHAAATAETWSSVAWSSSLDMLVAQAVFASTTSLMRSADKGVTWTSCVTSNTWKASGASFAPSIAALPTTSFFCSRVQLTTDSSYVALSSPDGVTFTAYALPSNTESPDGILAASTSPAQFVIPKGCYPSTGNPMSVLTSSDGGVTWTETDVVSITDVTQWAAVGWSDALQSLIACDNSTIYATLVGAFSAIDHVSPSHGPKAGGTVVTVFGSGLSGVTSVTFDGVPATDVTPAADGLSVTCITPAHASGAVTVAVA
jgi:hypothetical protein